MTLPFALVFIFAVALNYPWELAQSPLYARVPPLVARLWHCFVASLGDGVLVLLIAWFGHLVYRDAAWFLRSGLRRDATTVSVGLVVAVIVEWVAVHQLGRWSYGPGMPTVDLLGVAVPPLLQMVLLPPLVFRAVRAALERCPGPCL